MSFSERAVVTELITNVVMVALFAWVILARAEAGAFDGPDGLMHWARTVLVLLVVVIAVAIAVSVAFAILYAIVTGHEIDDRTDERDRAISALGWKVAMIATGAGFMGALAALAWGVSVLLALNLMLGAFALGDTAGNGARLIAYRRGG